MYILGCLTLQCIYMRVCVYVYGVYVCMYVCTYVCVCTHVCVCTDMHVQEDSSFWTSEGEVSSSLALYSNSDSAS